MKIQTKNMVIVFSLIFTIAIVPFVIFNYYITENNFFYKSYDEAQGISKNFITNTNGISMNNSQEEQKELKEEEITAAEVGMTESEITMEKYLQKEFMGDYNVTFLATDKIYVLTPAHSLETETIEMTINDRDTFAWKSFTELMNITSNEVSSTLGGQYQVALISKINGKTRLLYRVKNGQANYDYLKTEF